MAQKYSILFVSIGLHMALSFAFNAEAQTKSILKTPAKKTNVSAKKPVSPPLISPDPLAKPAAVSGDLISAVNVVGNRKIEKEAIVSKLSLKVGTAFEKSKARNDILALFQTGYFNDVEIDKDKNALTVKVKEKPSITEIEVEGNSELKDDEIKEASGIKAYQLYNPAQIKEASEKVQKLLEDKGFFLAKVDVKAEETKLDETVKITFTITENDKVKVKQITFIGNKKMSTPSLKSKMLTKEGGFFSFMSGSGQYKQEMFDRDLQILRFAYYNQGYVQAKIDRPAVTVTPDKKSIYITIAIDEGDQYSVGEVDFSGDVLFPKEELLNITQIAKNKIFAYDVLQSDISLLTAKCGDLGYAYANVIPRTRFDEKEKKVDLLFEFDKGSLVYLGKINVIGNTKTRDKVVRRELKISEGELYNETRKRASVENVQRLGFFEEVNFKTSVDPKDNNVMNIDIAVKERSTGQIQFGAGYGTAQGFTLTGSVNQTNFLGLGQNLGASLNISQFGNYYSLSFTEPYLFDSQYSVGFDLYQSANTARLDYDENHTGAAVRVGKPLSEYTRGYLRYKYDKALLKEKYDAAGVLITDTDLFPLPDASGETSSIQATIEYDTRNDRMTPTKGIFSSASFEYAGLGGQLKYTRANGTFRFFKNVFWDVIWRNSFQLSRISPLDGKPVPFNELYLLGGPYSLRGYRSYTVGRMKFSNKVYNDLKVNFPDAYALEQANRFYGGVQQAMYQTELLFPLVKEAGIMGVLFYDIGAADDIITDDQLFSDIGIGIRWFSPIGPLRFEWGFPLKRLPAYHDPTVFEFSIGTPF